MKILKSSFILISLFILGCYSAAPEATTFEEDELIITRLKNTSLTKATIEQPDSTTVTPVLDYPIETGENLVFCATVHLAWDKLEVEIGTPVQLEKSIDAQKELNKENYSNLIDKEDYIALYGNSEEVRAEITSQMQEKFGEKPDELPTGGSYILYSYLWKYLPFKTPFNTGTIQFNNQKVSSFYGNCYEMNEQGDLIFYSVVDDLEGFEKGEFILRINSEDNREEIIIAQVQSQHTLKATYEKVNKMVNRGRFGVKVYDETRQKSATIHFPIRMNEATYFEVPKFDFQIHHRFEELEGNHFIQIDKSIDIAEQSIRFKLDEYGALTKSYFTATDSTSLFPFPDFKVQDQFLIYIKQKDAELPYLAIWVDNAAILLKED